MPATAEGSPVARPPQGPTLEEAAERMEGLLELREANQGTQSDQVSEEAPAEGTNEGENVEAEAEAQETTADEAEAEAEAPEDAGTTKAQSPEDQLVTVRIDGKSEQVTLKEALEGYSRTEDYARKTASLANERRALNEQAKAISDERQTYATMLVALRNQLAAGQEKEPNWDEVYATDPIGYARKRDEWRDKQEKLAAANFELQRVQQLQQNEQRENLAKIVQQGRDKMLEMNPAWRDPSVWEQDRQLIVAFAQKRGYTPEEISQAYDPRAIVTLNEARLYNELMAGKPKPVVRAAPRVMAAGTVPDRTGTRLNAAQQRLAKSGSIDDAAKVFEQLLQ